MRIDLPFLPRRAWLTWFAWFPVVLDDGAFAWFETVERRRATWFGRWEHRAPVSLGYPVHAPAPALRTC